jgi:ferredoxin
MSKEQIHKHPKNVPGKYYVVYEHCLTHGVCEHCASSNFRIDDELPGAYVYKQPSTSEEDEQCREVFENCPVAAIRDDGDINTTIPKWEVENQ